jgi:hypothetical protein
MALPTGVIFIWTGTNASIPAGWTRETTLDGKFPKGTSALTNPNVTGGNSTHTHTSAGHTHTMDNHTHTITIAACNPNGNSDNGGSVMAANQHTHAPFTSGAVTSASISTESATYSAVSNNPPYYEVIFIKPSTPAGGLPDQAIGFSDDTGFTNNTGKYNGYYQCDGNNSTPNLTGKYLRGASTGANAGGTGGSTTNVHELTHTHTVSHAHATVTSPASGGIGARTSGGGWIQNHTHDVGLNASTTAPTTNPTLTTSETVEPSHKIINTIQNRSGTAYTPVGIIGMWLGTLSTIPSNFELVTSMADYYPKINTSSLGTTGGSNTHTHASQSHSHTVSHTHTSNPAQPFHVDTNSNRTGSGSVTCNQNYNSVHPSVDVTTENYTLASASTSADSSNNEPEYVTVAFIKYKGEKGGAFLFNFTR